MTIRRRPVVLVAAQGDIGGAERVLLHLLARTPSDDVVVCAPAGSALERQVVSLGHRVRDVSLPKLAHSRSRWAWVRAYGRALRSLHAAVRSERACAIHGFAAFTIKLVVPVSVATRIPALVTVHEVTTPDSIGASHSRAQRVFGSRRLSLVVAVSSYVADGLVASGYPPQRVVVVHNGVARASPLRPKVDARQQLGVAQDTLVFVVVGRMSRLKGAHVAIEALDLFLRTPGSPPAQLVLVGGPGAPEDDAYVRHVEQLVADHGLGPSVRFAGQQTDVEVFYDACDVVLVPSVEPDAFPTVVLEGGLAGRPVVASDCGGAREAIVEGVTGLVVAPTAAAFAGAMQRCGDPSWREAAGTAARRHVAAAFPLDRFAAATHAQWEAVARREAPLPR